VTRPTALLALLAVAVAVAGCGEREEPQPAAPPQEPLELVLDYLPNADHAGIYAAQAGGHFRDAGLDVRLRTPTDPAAPLRLVAAGRADVAISYEPELLLARDEGVRVQSIGALVQRPLTSVTSLPGRGAVRRPEDLRGKRVGTAGIPYQDAYLRSILERGDVPQDAVRRIDVGFNLTPTLLSRRVDATLGAFWNVEGVELRRRGRDPVIVPVDRLGVPTYDELVLVAGEETVRSRGNLLRRLMQALTRGHEDVRRDIAAGVDPLLEAASGLRRDLAEAQVRATVPVFFPERPGRPFGWHEAAEWQAYARWMGQSDLLEDPRVVQRAFTNEFLPGEGV
jgi:putative hydroxymethylpyrimidine transport system substrate-binding protein